MNEIVGEEWQERLFNIADVVKPMDVDAIERILNGEDYYSVFGNKDKD